MEKNPAIRTPAFVQLFLLVLQTIYLILFYADIGHFTFYLAFYFNLMLAFSFVTSLSAFIAYWAGFFRNTPKQRILFASLFLLHLGIAYYSFYITLGTLISRC